MLSRVAESVLRLAAVAGLTLALALAGHDSGEVLPVDHPAIQYAKLPVDDAVTRLQKRLDAGEVRLQYDEKFGYLKSILKELNAPASSQVLVFSKTSFQATKISPRTPRALYFGDDVTVGFVRQGDVLEFAAPDSRQGTIFYTLDQGRSAKPHFIRRDICLQCHLSPATQGVPGLVVRSVTPDWNGFPAGKGDYITDHRSPLKERWGGWYVTGNLGMQDHMGNRTMQRPGETTLPEMDETRNLTELGTYIEPAEYLTPHSDVVALMVLEHQTQMLNRIARLGWEARLGRDIAPMVDEFVSYALLQGEAKLTEPVRGTSGFAEEFSKRGPLYELDLKTRLFRYPCSFLIYSPAWDAIPAEVKARVYRGMWDAMGRWPEAERRALVEILLKTKTGLPDYWKL